jgi:hypothetical protein
MDQGPEIMKASEYEEMYELDDIFDKAQKTFTKMRKQVREGTLDRDRWTFEGKPDGYCPTCQQVTKWIGSGASDLVDPPSYANRCLTCKICHWTPIDHSVQRGRPGEHTMFAFAKSNAKEVEMIGWFDIERHFKADKGALDGYCLCDTCRKGIYISHAPIGNGDLCIYYTPLFKHPTDEEFPLVDSGIRMFLIDTETGVERRDMCPKCAPAMIEQGHTPYTAVITKNM